MCVCVCQDQPEDPRGCLMVQVFLQGLTLSRIMVHHQHASMDQLASADVQVCVSEVGGLSGVFSALRPPEQSPKPVRVFKKQI